MNSKRKASTALEDEEELSPLAEAVRRVSPFVSITPTNAPGVGPSGRKRVLVEDRLEVRPVTLPTTSAATSTVTSADLLVQPSTSRGLSNTPRDSQNKVPTTRRGRKILASKLTFHTETDSEDEELARLEARLQEEGDSSEDEPEPDPVGGADVDEDAELGDRVAYIHVGEGCEADLEAQLKGAENLDIQILEEETLPDIDESDMIHGLDHTGTARDYVDERHRCTIHCPVGCQGHLRPNEIVIYESFKWNGKLRGRRRYDLEKNSDHSKRTTRSFKRKKMLSHIGHWAFGRLGPINYDL